MSEEGGGRGEGRGKEGDVSVSDIICVRGAVSWVVEENCKSCTMGKEHGNKC